LEPYLVTPEICHMDSELTASCSQLPHFLKYKVISLNSDSLHYESGYTLVDTLYLDGVP